jgi:hypothetical protein
MQGVHTLRTVDRHRRDAAFFLIGNKFVCHGQLSPFFALYDPVRQGSKAAQFADDALLGQNKT